MSNYPGMPMQIQKAMNRMAAYNLRRDPQQSSDFGESLGGAIGRAAKAPKTSGDKDKPSHDASMYGKYVQGTGANVGVAQAGQPYVDNQSVLDNADKNVRVNQMAEDARIGGKFTPNGLEAAGKRAEANGFDRYQLKGLAGTQVREAYAPNTAGPYQPDQSLPGYQPNPSADQSQMSPGMGPGGF